MANLELWLSRMGTVRLAVAEKHLQEKKSDFIVRIPGIQRISFQIFN